MKKTIILSSFLLLLAGLNHSFAGSESLLNTGEPQHFRTLIINANVNVVLVGNENATLHVNGSGNFDDFIALEVSGDTLVIAANKKKQSRGGGTIYVPASRMHSIRVNSGANVRSLHSLQIPRLDVVINGACTINIANIGELNMIETEAFAFDHRVDVRTYPAALLRQP